MRYLVDSEAYVFSGGGGGGIRNPISRMGKTTWANTDTRLGHIAVIRGHIRRQIAIDELGRDDAIKDFLQYMELVSRGESAKRLKT